MARARALLRKSREAMKDLNLVKILQSEINHELSSDSFQNHQSGSLGDFELEYDVPHTQDVILRKKCETGEEVAVSALLGPGCVFPRDVMMKVCIRKPGLSSILHFDCGVSCDFRASSSSYGSSGLYIRRASYLKSQPALLASNYKEASFRDLDPRLEEALKEYLKGKGIEESLMNYLVLHLHKKEQNQYVNWLQKLTQMVSGGGK